MSRLRLLVSHVVVFALGALFAGAVLGAVLLGSLVPGTPPIRYERTVIEGPAYEVGERLRPLIGLGWEIERRDQASTRDMDFVTYVLRRPAPAP